MTTTLMSSRSVPPKRAPKYNQFAYSVTADRHQLAARLVGARIAEARHKAGLNQRQLAEALKTNQTTICQIETGLLAPVRGYAKFAEVLNTDLLWLTSGVPAPTPTKENPMKEPVFEATPVVPRQVELLHGMTEAERIAAWELAYAAILGRKPSVVQIKALAKLHTLLEIESLRHPNALN